MKADHRSPPSRSTLERMATSIGTDARRVAPRIEPRLRRAEHVPAGAVALSMGRDRTSVPMEEAPPAGEAPATRRKTRRQPYERTPLDAVAVGELAASHPIPIGVTRHVGVGLHDVAQGGHRGDEEVRRGDRHRGAQAQDSRSQ